VYGKQGWRNRDCWKGRVEVEVLMKVYQIDKLSECVDVANVDLVLDELNIEKELNLRVPFLYQHMGITQSFSSNSGPGGLTMEQEYAFAKQQLVLMNKRRRKNNEHE